MPISKIKENSLASGAITEANVGADIINAQTELTETANEADFILVYDTSAGGLKKVLKSNFTLQVPTISSVSPTNAISGDGTGNYTFVITGTNFTGGSANLINSSGTAVAFDTVTVDSSTQITGVIAKSSLPGSGEPYDVKVTATNGLSTTLTNQINIDQQPVYSTASGSLGTVPDSSRAGTSFTVFASDPESGGDVTYTLESGSLPTGMSLTSTSSGAVISGTPDAVGSNTTSTFTIRAKDVNSNTSDRQFTITINAPVSQSFTSSGTFSVPSGITSVNVLVVAGGGGGAGGGYGGGGGGAGGLIYRPAFTVTPGGTVSVTVGCGGASSPAPNCSGPKGTPGQDSVFGTLTAKGGGGGGYFATSGLEGGNGGGAGRDGPQPGGTATQPTQPGDSGTYGFGNPGGNGGGPTLAGAGGGGGAGAAGQNGGPNDNPITASPESTRGFGGVGKAYTIADGTTSVYYAGGGGGSRYPSDYPGGQGGQGGGGDGGKQNEDNFPSRVGTANRGGGGGAADRGPGTEGTAGGGGKGIVIVRY